MTSQEEQNYYRFHQLIFKIAKAALDKYFLSKMSTSLTSISDNAKHNLFHLWKVKERCCKCIKNPTLSKQSSLFRYQWDDLFGTDDSANCGVKHCICVYKAKAAISVDDLDIVLEIRLMQQCLVMSPDVEESIEIIHKFRNKISHPKLPRITNVDFSTHWKEAAKYIMLIAKECSSDVASDLQKDIDSLLNSIAEKPSPVNKDKQINEDLEKVTRLYEDSKKLEEAACYDPYEESTSKQRNLDISFEDSLIDQDAPDLMQSSFQQIETQRSMDDHWKLRERIEQLLPYLYDNLDPITIVQHFHHHELLTKQQRQQILDMNIRRKRVIEFLKIVKQTSDEIFFLESLSSTGQERIHEQLTGEHQISSVQICFVNGLPYVDSSEPVRNVQIVLRCMGENGAIVEQMLLDKLKDNHDVCDNIIKDNMELSLKESQEGSVVMHLYSKDADTDTLDIFQTAFVKGDIMKTTRKLIKYTEPYHEGEIMVTFRIDKKEDMPLSEENNVYRSHMEYLLEELCPKPVAAVLYEKQVLSLHEVKLVFSDQHWDRRSQVHQLIKIMTTKQHGLQPFLQALRETFQYATANALSLSEKTFYKNNLDYLLNELCPKPIAAVLYEMEIINQHEVQLVFSAQHRDRVSQVKQLVKILVTHQGSVEPFKQALRNTYQDYIAEAMSTEALEVELPNTDFKLQCQTDGITEVSKIKNVWPSTSSQNDQGYESDNNEEKKNKKCCTIELKRKTLLRNKMKNTIVLQPSNIESKQRFLGKIFKVYNRLGNILNDCDFNFFISCVKSNRLAMCDFREDQDFLCVFSYMWANYFLILTDSQKSINPINKILQLSSHTTCPNLAGIFYHNAQTRRLLLVKDYLNLSKALDEAKTAIENNWPGNAGRAAGWVYVNDARYKIAQMSQLDIERVHYEKDYQQLFDQAKVSFEHALMNFAVDDSEDKEFGTEYTLYRLVILLMRCGDDGKTMDVQQALEEDIRQAEKYLIYSSPRRKSLRVHRSLATCDYQFRLGDLTGALDCAVDAFRFAKELNLKEFIKDARKRMHFLNGKLSMKKLQMCTISK